MTSDQPPKLRDFFKQMPLETNNEHLSNGKLTPFTTLCVCYRYMIEPFWHHAVEHSKEPVKFSEEEEKAVE